MPRQHSTNEMVLNSKVSPVKLHSNMANMLIEQKMNEDKESFVRTVMTARQKSDQFNNLIRQKDGALTGRNPTDGRTSLEQ